MHLKVINYTFETLYFNLPNQVKLVRFSSYYHLGRKLCKSVKLVMCQFLKYEKVGNTAYALFRFTEFLLCQHPLTASSPLIRPPSRTAPSTLARVLRLWRTGGLTSPTRGQAHVFTQCWHRIDPCERGKGEAKY